MGAVDVTKIRWVTGRLSVDPTDPDLTGTWPFGGTGLGASQRVAWIPGLSYEPVRAAEWGGEPVEYVMGGQAPRLLCDLREWFGDAHATVWPEASSGDLPFPGSVRTGSRLSDQVVTLLFTADDPTVDPSLIFYAAVPLPAREAQLPLSIYRELAHPVVFAALRDSNGNVYDKNLLTSLSYPSA